MPADSISEPVKTVSGYLEQIKFIQVKWNFKPAQELWFRGEERNFKTKLFSKVYRPDHPTDFLLRLENEVLEGFQRRASHLCSEDIGGRFESYMQMQHHGGPTRLLDWSDGALIALHFAVKRTSDDSDPRFVYVVDPNWLNDETLPKTEPESDASDEPDEDDLVVQLYLPDEVDDIGDIPEKPLVLEFHQTTRRMGAQRSRFVLCGRDRHWLPSKINEHGSRLTVISIADGAAPSLREELRVCGITESVIFPDLDGLGREMTDIWRTLLTV